MGNKTFYAYDYHLFLFVNMLMREKTFSHESFSILQAIRFRYIYIHNISPSNGLVDINH